jgi:hypothetical protein
VAYWAVIGWIGIVLLQNRDSARSGEHLNKKKVYLKQNFNQHTMTGLGRKKSLDAQFIIKNRRK